ncbi:MAG: histidine phosphatase family protein [Holophagaceae bacterium]|nr:histidine phosphatase family protein [Holophagaceae bacterium]
MLKTWMFTFLLALSLGAQDTVVIFLRHAEKTHHGDTAELSAAGRRRAAALPLDLQPYRPVALFASDLRRTQQTLEPLATRLGQPLQIYERGREAALGQRLLSLYEGQTVVVCGHSDTLGALVRALGHAPEFPEVQGFDRFWVLRIPERKGPPSLEDHRQKHRPR